MKNYKEEYRDCLKIQGKAENTIKRYNKIINDFLLKFPNPEKATKHQITQFLLKRGAGRTIKQAHGALNIFFTEVLNSDAICKIKQPKVSEFIPDILTQNEVKQICNSINNLKHKAIIQLIYSCALRIGECRNLRVVDIEKDRNTIKIINGKGNKDAFIPIPPSTKKLLRIYYKKYHPDNYLFKGQGNEKYSEASIRKILEKAIIKCNIKKNIRVHDLRHSRATHWLENGMDIKIIQRILRHKKPETTDRYIHLETQSLENAMLEAETTLFN